jgi:hypothetical protein
MESRPSQPRLYQKEINMVRKRRKKKMDKKIGLADTKKDEECLVCTTQLQSAFSGNWKQTKTKFGQSASVQ